MSYETEFELLDELIDAAPGSERRRILEARLQAGAAGRHILAWHLDLQAGPAPLGSVNVTPRVMARIQDLPTPVRERQKADALRAAPVGRRAPDNPVPDRQAAASTSLRTRLGEWVHALFAPQVSPGITRWRLAFLTASLAVIALFFWPGLASIPSETLAGAAVRGAGPGGVPLGLGVGALVLLWWFGRGKRS